MVKPQDYYNQVIGKGIDYDGVYGVQCVDGFKHFCSSVLGLNLGTICSPSNLAFSIWDNVESLELNKYFDKVPADQMVDGDWAIWNVDSKPAPSSHIAMFRKDNGNGTGVFLGQNQKGGPGYNQVNISYNGLRGALRPKIYHQEITENKENTSNQKVQFKCIGDMYVRNGAGTNHGIKLVKDLSEDGRRNATSNKLNAYGVYKAGTVFDCLDLITNKYGIWAKTYSGYVCIQGASGKEYCVRV